MRLKNSQINNSIFPKGVGIWCHELARELWPIPRFLTGAGVRETLQRLQQDIPELTVEEIPSGSTVFDWTIPDEWVIRNAYIEDESGNRIIDFKINNLHIIGYSEPIDLWIDLEDLQSHLYSLPEQPNAVPYVTSYYKRRWGFCISHEQRTALAPGKYHAVIDSDLGPGVLNYGEILISGKSSKEIFLSTYICHPSMANNELSGPVVAAALTKWIKQLSDRKYSYRIVFIPETIGSIAYISRNIKEMKDNTYAGFNLSCLGDDRCYSFLPSRDGNTISDNVAQHVLYHTDSEYKKYSWLNRGSDERQYCAPGVDLPIATIMRSKYGTYPEYHTSLDDLETVVTPNGLLGGFEVLQKAISIIEQNFTPKITTLCEPQLGKRGLYPDISIRGAATNARTMINMISYCSGTKTLFEIAETIDEPFWQLLELIEPLVNEGLIEIQDS